MLKNNTLAIALGALLVGGVATAGFINNNSKVAGQPTALADDAGRSIDSRARTGLDYADVVGVEPVIEREERYATVIGTDPVRESSSTTTPQQVCEDVAVQQRMPERDGNVGGTVAGALIGGAARIGCASVVGIGAVVRHGLTIGNHSVLGAGAVLTRDLPDGVVAWGAPARIQRSREPGERYL